MNRFLDCLQAINNNEKSYEKAAEILKVVIMPPAAIIEAMKGDPKLFQLFLGSWQNWNDSTKVKVAQSMAEWVQTDALSAQKFWEMAMHTGDVNSAIQILHSVFNQLRDSPDRVAILNDFFNCFFILPELLDNKRLFFRNNFDYSGN